MKQLSRKKIQDMIDLNGANISSRRSSGGSGAGGGGGVSSAWVDEHYVSKDFFARLFTINGTDENDDDVVVEPNDLETTITNIQAMVGLWTEEYLSALGQGSGGGGGGGALLTEPLASINEAGMGTPSGANKVIVWNGSTWTYKPYNTGNGTVTSIRIAVPMGFSVNPSTAITTSGTFTISFARGTLGNGMVLATPSSGTGDPIWRALVADDIPTLTAAKISDITLTDGTLTIGNNSITPITDATLKSNYTWWGGAIDSTGKREGNMSNVGNISFSASGKNIGGVAYFDTNNHRLGIGISPGAYKLDVNGNIRTSGNLYIGGTNRILSGSGDSAKNLLEFDGTQVTLAYGFRASNETRIYGQNISMYHGSTLKVQVTSTGLKIGDATLSWDSTNHALKIDTGFYSESFISALGAGSGGGGGSGITMNDVWSALAVTAPNSSSQQINVTHMTQALSSYASKTWVQSQGFVTTDTAQTISGTKTFSSIYALTFTNGANNRVFSINNNGSIKLDVANVGASNGWEAGYYAKSGNTYIGCLGLFGVGTALEYAFIGKGYDNTWLTVKPNGNVGIGTNNTSPMTKLHVDGIGYFTSGVSVGGIDQYHAFYVNGNTKLSGLVGIGTSAQSGYSLYVNGDTNVNGTLTSGNLMIKKDSNGKMTIQTIPSGTGLPPYDLDIYAGNIYINAATSFSGSKSYSASDMRYKVVLENISCDVNTIAEAPIFDFKWKDDEYNNISLGSSAQYWKAVFPNAVKESQEGRYFLDYGGTALAAAVLTARKVVKHEERIKALEAENERLRNEVEQLKVA